MRNSSQAYSLSRGEKVNGWIFDLYPGKAGEMVVWVKTNEGPCYRLVDEWRPHFYVSAPSLDDLTSITWYLPQNEGGIDCELAERFLKLQDSEPSKVLKVTVPDVHQLRFTARRIWQLGRYRKYQLWNVDIPPSQMYLHDKNLFPLAYVEATAGSRCVSWKLMDSTHRLEYSIPRLRTVNLKVEIDKHGNFPGFGDPITFIQLEFEDQKVEISLHDEGEKILKLAQSVEDLDPDIIVTDGGDSFLLTYLARRASENNVLSKLILGREKTDICVSKRRGNSYFSYGRVYYRYTPQRLLGRLHLDVENSGLYAQYGLDGLVEVARTCRIPLHRASRVSIGTCMTAIQLYQAVKDGFLVPWKKSEPENFKTAMDLLVADRGGFYFEPKLGIHNNVGEIDFSSMYPMLMLTKNISPETIGCKCCPNSTNRVPELGYNICERRVGIVPNVLRLMLDKRLYYKKMRNEARSHQEKVRYDQRQAAYKIILCTCFGYLGYRNARFGKADAYISACAFARKTLQETANLAERRGFDIVHGIVDSLYLKREKATDEDFVELCREITKRTGLPISFEGMYRWIVFLPSKIHFGVSVLNRFYGVFQNGKIKARGIEARRGDTPNIVKRFQNDVLHELSKAKDSEEFLERVPNAFSILKKYVRKIVNKEVEPGDLVISKRLSKNPEQYLHNVHQAIAAKQLQAHGIEITAGQIIKYILLDANNKYPERRVSPAQLKKAPLHYDTKEYAKLLNDAIHNILSPFLKEPAL